MAFTLSLEFYKISNLFWKLKCIFAGTSIDQCAVAETVVLRLCVDRDPLVGRGFRKRQSSQLYGVYALESVQSVSGHCIICGDKAPPWHVPHYEILMKCYSALSTPNAKRPTTPTVCFSSTTGVTR
ncbi:hypothetical protein T11_5792 [Trichinella zimbabwensis]|uniref:Uncharacterized protein n=1 Tax=Trichinella zimbabwensis TaxID=268475 RepID=A0A0V1HS62_9BILA|nr:hypothetical protein T11_5792 [Trichinella zimbabwensis]